VNSNLGVQKLSGFMQYLIKQQYYQFGIVLLQL